MIDVYKRQWEIDTGSGAGYKFVDDKFMWLKSIENVNDLSLIHIFTTAARTF